MMSRQESEKDISTYLELTRKKLLENAVPMKNIFACLESQIKKLRKDVFHLKVNTYFSPLKGASPSYYRKMRGFVTQNNFPSVSYLDLAHHGDICLDIPGLSRLAMKHDLMDILMEYYNLIGGREEYLRREMFADAWLTYLHFTFVSMVIEFMIMAQKKLAKKWDVVWYKRCMNVSDQERPNCVGLSFVLYGSCLEILPRLMLEHGADADLAIHFFFRMCNSTPSILRLIGIRPEYMQFFLMNLAAVEGVLPPQSPRIERWYLKEFQLVERAFEEGRTENLRLLLLYFWPNYFWTYRDDLKNCEWLCSREEESGANKVTSQYTYQFTLHLMVSLSSLVAKSSAPKAVLADCIRLVWRTVETPYLSIEDIEEAFRTVESSNIPHIRESDFKSQFLLAYPMDCAIQYQPRSLLHLSRCKIRSSVISASNFYYLPLPKELMAYIHLEW